MFDNCFFNFITSFFFLLLLLLLLSSSSLSLSLSKLELTFEALMFLFFLLKIGQIEFVGSSKHQSNFIISFVKPYIVLQVPNNLINNPLK